MVLSGMGILEGTPALSRPAWPAYKRRGGGRYVKDPVLSILFWAIAIFFRQRIAQQHLTQCTKFDYISSDARKMQKKYRYTHME
ncbi:hypothetical protein [Janthinobacterium rivuli]|uniref:hypothetical protein n=1 Tax=Janthinobacterium rivuli TaxID=2751478 RepID=UPI00383BB382